jgi:hypothetical protein
MLVLVLVLVIAILIAIAIDPSSPPRAVQTRGRRTLRLVVP